MGQVILGNWYASATGIGYFLIQIFGTNLVLGTY